MIEDRQRWNRKYRRMDSREGASTIVRRFYHHASAGRALDIAAGDGRNALWLAQNGFTVDAVDISDVALSRCAGRHPALFPICADLDRFDIAPQRYNLIVNVRYLNRGLFPAIIKGLVPDGILIFETFRRDEKSRASTQHRTEHYLEDNELLHAFLSLRIFYYRENAVFWHGEHRKSASLVGVKLPFPTPDHCELPPLTHKPNGELNGARSNTGHSKKGHPA
jgi:SAM-dependent methyltransferase